MTLEAVDIAVLNAAAGGSCSGVNLRVEPGKFTALIGPNGGGKSSLLKALAGLWPSPKGK